MIWPEMAKNQFWAILAFLAITSKNYVNLGNSKKKLPVWTKKAIWWPLLEYHEKYYFIKCEC